LGIGDWGLGPIPNPQSPIPNPPIPKNYIHKIKLNKYSRNLEIYKYLIIKII
jgi:hypothetical protein